MTRRPSDGTVVAGIGCRIGCPTDDILAAIHQAQQACDRVATTLAAPAFKHDEPGLLAAAAHLGLPLLLIGHDALLRAQPACRTHSAAALAATGLSSIAEAAAIAACNGTLIVPRLTHGAATCAIAVP